MARNYAALKHDYLFEMEELTDAEFGRLCRELLKYSIDGTESQMKGNERFYWKRIKVQEDRAKESYEEMIGQKSKAGKKSAENRAKNTAQQCSTVFNGAQQCSTHGNKTNNNENENKNENNLLPANAGGREKRQSRFVPPAREEVAEYCRQRGNNVDPERFSDHYEANGWMVGRNKMRDWKAAVRNWEKRNKDFGASRETANERYTRELQDVIAAEGGDGLDPWGGG